MNWLGRMLFGDDPARAAQHDEVRPGDALPPPPPPAPLTRCPDCEGLDFTRICTLVGLRGTESVERGARYCCEDCAAIWSVSASGMRRANPRAVPIIMQPPKPTEVRETQAPKPPPLREEGPVPRTRPRA